MLHPEEQLSSTEATLPEVVVFGAGRLGTVLLTRLREQGTRATGIDFDPVAVRRLRELGYRVRFGDAADPEFVGDLPLSALRIGVSIIRVPDVVQGALADPDYPDKVRTEPHVPVREEPEET